MSQLNACNTNPSTIPLKNAQYSDSEFWENRYSKYANNIVSSDNITCEWFGNYLMFCNIFRKYVDKSASILILGCGNSLLAEELYDDGYTKVHNIDISQSVINIMSKHCEKCSNMKWYTMDCKKLEFENETFDVIIEKATIEIFLVKEKSPWNVSDSAINSLTQVANEIVRVLKRNTGQFISISFSAPHFRQSLFDRVFTDPKSNKPQMVVSNVHQLGHHFHYYLYHLTNDPSIEPISLFTYEPPKVSNIQDYVPKDDEIDDEETENFLYIIDL